MVLVPYAAALREAHVTVATIDELSTELGRLGQRFGRQGNRLGYFAALYGLMTGRVAEGVAAGRFQDSARMERLACHFAGRYLAAFERFEAGAQAPACWTVAFEAASSWRPIVLQHLMLGMNAHINFDLGIAAAEMADDGDIRDVQRDFEEINAVLAELLGDVQDRIASVSPWMGILDTVGGRKDEEFVNFSMRHARRAAWGVATAFSPMNAAGRARAEADLDERIARLARIVLTPGIKLTAATLAVRVRETASPAEVIEALSRVER